MYKSKKYEAVKFCDQWKIAPVKHVSAVICRNDLCFGEEAKWDKAHTPNDYMEILYRTSALDKVRDRQV